jgi:hypothetical protein
MAVGIVYWDAQAMEDFANQAFTRSDAAGNTNLERDVQELRI